MDNFCSILQKIDRIIENSIRLSIRVIFWSSLLSLLSVVIILSMSDLWAVSRFFVLSYVLISFLCELCFTSFLKIYIKSKIVVDGDSLLQNKGKISNKFYIKWLLPGIFFLILIYVMLTYFSSGTFQYNILHEKNFLILISSWGLGTLLTNRYKEPNTINHYYEIAPYIKGCNFNNFIFNIFLFFIEN